MKADQLVNILHALYERLNLTESDRYIKLPLENPHRPENLHLVNRIMMKNVKGLLSFLSSWKKKSNVVKIYDVKI